MKKKILLSSIGTIVICLCLIAGSTFALFTTSDEVNVAVTAGKVALTANLDDSSLLTWSLYQTEDDARTDGLFDNGGTAEITDEATVVIDRMTPGDVAKFMIDVENTSNVGVQYRVRMVSNAGTHEVDLTEALTITAYIDGYNYPTTGTENATLWKYVEPNAEINDIWVTVSFPNDAVIPADDYNGDGELNDNDYQEATANMSFIVEAVQGNAYDYNAVNLANDGSEMLGDDGYLPEGIYNGEGETLTVTNSLPVAGNVTLSNITLEGDSVAAIYATPVDSDDPSMKEESSMIVLAEGTNIVVDNGCGVEILRFLPETEDTLIIDEGAKITGTNESCAIFAQSQGGTLNLVLNASGLIDVDASSVGIFFDGITVNIFVKDATAMAEYSAMIESVNTTINWYIDGTPINYTNN